MLKKIHRFEIELRLLSGMHIAGSDDAFDIGGPDAQVVKNAITKEPYIPGSSMKGKLRSLLDYKYGHITVDKNDKKNYCIDESSNDSLCLALFEPLTSIEPMITRGIFRDFVLTEESKKVLQDTFGDNIFTEIKAENKINRFTGKADSPRFIERVPAGSVFVGEIDILEFDNDYYDEIKNYLIEALELLKYNFIGGSGTRGYGRVEIKILKKEEIGND